MELLVVLGVTFSVFALTLPFAINKPSDAQLEKYLQELEFSIFSMQQSAYSRKNNKSYGVAFFTNKYTIFAGTSLSTAEFSRETVFSGVRLQTIALNNSATEIVFDAGSFKPNVSGYLNLTNNARVIRLDITAEGKITRI